MHHGLRTAPSGGGFTLIELLAVISTVALLFTLAFSAIARSMDAAHTAKCAAQLRQIASAYHLYAADHDKMLPTAEMLGNSSYRSLDDPMSLPNYFQPYLNKDSVWMCPRGRKTLAPNKVNYAWSRAQNLVGTAGAAGAYSRAVKTTVVWDNLTYALPSVYNVPESASGGPMAVTSVLRYYPHKGKSAVNYLLLDGHVELR